MTEKEWLACDHPAPMFRHLGRMPNKRKARLYAVACCRHAWEGMPKGPCRQAVEVAERLADGQAGEKERLAAFRALPRKQSGVNWNAVWAAESAVARHVARMLRAHVHTANVVAQHRAAGDLDLQSRLWDSDYSTYPALVRCVFGNPFRPAAVAPEVLAWHDGLLRSTATQMYDARNFAEMAVLADMLEDAGYRDPEVLAHCRGPGPHVRGCWAIDSIQGRK
jgi:hypothetical protein